MSHTHRGLALSMYLSFAVVAGFIFLSYTRALRKVEPMSLEASFSSDFNNDSRSRLEWEIQNTKKKIDEAEVTPDSQAFEKLADASDLETTQDIDVPVLGSDVPSWISQRVVEENRIIVPIESSLHATLEECRSELASRLPTEVKKIVDEYVLKQVSADDIPGLTPEYIKEKLIDSSVEFDNYQERPSGNFHQLWVKLNIDKKELQRIREWEREVLSTVRVWMLGGLSLAFLGSFAGLSEVFKSLSIRDQKRRGSPPSA